MVDGWTAICTATYNSLLGLDPEITQQTVQKAVSPSLSTRFQLHIPATLTSLSGCFYEAGNVSPKKNATCKIGGSHSGVADDTIILGSKAVSLSEKFPTFGKIVMPSSSGSGTPRKICGMFFPEDDGARAHRNLGNYFPQRHNATPQKTCNS